MMKLSLPVELDNAHVRFVRRYARRLAVQFPAYKVDETLALSNLLWRAIQMERRLEVDKVEVFHSRRRKAVTHA